AFLVLRTLRLCQHHRVMAMYRRRLPHVVDTDHPVFLTWRLAGSIPTNRFFSNLSLTSGQAFAAMDRVLDEASSGPTYLLIPEIAQIVVDTLKYQGSVLLRYKLHAYVVMANHVHAVVTPSVQIPMLTRTLKSYSARRANEILARQGAFWAEETFDRTIRNRNEFARICGYVENNPVKAGLASLPENYRWSSAWKAGSPAPQPADRLAWPSDAKAEAAPPRGSCDPPS
ncbi:MAG: transposase, partial [Acidobacteriota bacterium]